MAQPKSDNSFLAKSKFKWDDIEPVQQYDGDATILNFKYTPDYQELMDYFRAIVQKQEISERAYEIAGFVIEVLCSNYNAWYIRKQCLEKLTDKLSYENEKEFIDELIEQNEKVFQIWDHRKYVIEKLNDCSGEIDFLEDVFYQDNKNYHAWSYRIWLCEQFNLYKDEWDLIQKYFKEDIRNNSAYNYRYFLFQYYFYKENEKNIDQELEFAFQMIQEDPENESSWNYLQGFFQKYEFKSLQQYQNDAQKNEISTKNNSIFHKPISNHKFSDFPQVKKFALKLLEENQENRFLLNLLINIYLLENENILTALQHLNLLATKADKIRVNYWNWFTQNVEKDFQSQINKEKQTQTQKTEETKQQQ
ncbi:hypothetical protein PPERSA_02400 [Pseudocohnilembus persalinus]|uniref:Protein farnesyltransferase/geranylgeranyltransferase type-1 subunit alpha n=1 Tax=Pseudocohnilembus persalinus TaxID=266149 RepID=A0A0V0QBC6_PSEPJ|nr:hypothetical protein PPERSA_02400 [Pseudocohnilembus persalinus]|eukprot:KRW99542.1 hypothetical protein PPERSA_02400 [Pseudocohnilembus persalinus]